MNQIAKEVNADKELEARIDAFEETIGTYAANQGKNAAENNQPKSLAEYNALVVNYVKSRTQAEMDFVNAYLNPIAGMTNAHSLEKSSKERIESFKPKLKDLSDKIVSAELEKRKIPFDHEIQTTRMIANGVTMSISGGEGWLMFDAMNASSIPVLASIPISILVALGVWAAIHFAFGGIIQQANNPSRRFVRYCLVLVPAFIALYFLCDIRAGAYDAAIRYASLDPSLVVDTEAGDISGLALTVTSFVLFLVALVIDVQFHETETERQHKLKRKEIESRLNDLRCQEDGIQSKIKTIENESIEVMREARNRFEQALYTEGRLKSIAECGLAIFISTNLRFRNDGVCPSVFNDPPSIEFKSFTENLKPPNQ